MNECSVRRVADDRFLFNDAYYLRFDMQIDINLNDLIVYQDLRNS